MQRTQIYFEQHTLKELKKIALELNVSVSEFIRSVVKKQHSDDMQTFIAQMKPIESFTDVDATEYVQRLRGRSRIVHD